MFDYIFAEMDLPFVQCTNCNHKMKFHGGWYPSQITCQNCGQEMILTNALKKLIYPNYKYDKDGFLIREEK